VTQMKAAALPGASARVGAPPVYLPYSPQAQMKPGSGPVHSALSAAPVYRPSAPPVYRPNSVVSLQAKQGIAASPVYGHQPVQPQRPHGAPGVAAVQFGGSGRTSVAQPHMGGVRAAVGTSAAPTDVIQQAGWGTWALGALGVGAVGVGLATLGLPMTLGAAAVGAGLKLAYEYSTGGKIDKDVFVGQDESREDIKRDVDSAMVKIQLAFTAGVFRDLELAEQGRDEPVYAFGKWLVSAGLGRLIRGWNNRWSLEDTAGLLLDAGSKIKQKPEFLQEHGRQFPNNGDDPPNLLSNVHETVRRRNKKFKLTGDSPEAVWARGINRDFVVNAGPSATTATLLNFLSIFPITIEEREAIMQAAILFWRGKTKRLTGDYHTGAEVWMAYTRRLQIEGHIPPNG
jgi:hypothetical protein